MTIQPLNPSNAALLDNYSSVGDMTLVILCILLLTILRQTFLKHSTLFFLFKIAISALCISSVSNILFYHTAAYYDNDMALFVLHAISHISLLYIFCQYIVYMTILLNISGRRRSLLVWSSYALLVITSVLDALSPALHLNLYRDTFGNWVNLQSVWQPFNIAYFIYMAVLLIIIIGYYKYLPIKLANVLLFTEAMCIYIAVSENIHGHNSYLALTFLMPILVILYMVHAHSYSLKTGALNAASMDEYLSHQKNRKNTTFYLCLSFDTDSEFILPDKMGKMFYNFWRSYFKSAIFFHPTSHFFVLAVDAKHVDRPTERAIELIHNDFEPKFNAYRIPYKIVIFRHADFCDSNEKLLDLYNFVTKKLPANTIKICDSADYKAFQRRNYIISQLKDISDNAGIDDPRILVYCQPVRNVNSDCYDTAEALMRLNLPELGIVLPNDFIPLAEHFGYIHKLSMIILNKTCAAVKQLKDEGYILSRISVNLSIRELSEPAFMEQFESIVQKNGLPCEMIAVELTESRNDTEYEIVLDRVNKFKKLGVYTYLDDFGTGYSNFDRILSLKLDVVKFDRSLLIMAANDDNARFLLDYFSSAFEKLGYKVLYEGVETKDQEEMCVQSHADYLQGYKFSKPIPIDNLRSFLQKA